LTIFLEGEVLYLYYNQKKKKKKKIFKKKKKKKKKKKFLKKKKKFINDIKNMNFFFICYLYYVIYIINYNLLI